MFYDKSFIDSLLRCQLCNQSYDDYDQPRLLPCGKTICSQCIIQIEHKIRNNTFECSICNEKHALSDKCFPVNEIAANLIAAQPKEVYRGKETETLKQNLLNLEKLLNELAFDTDNGCDKIKQHCNELKRLVQLSTEHKIVELNEVNYSLVKKIDAYEKECCEKYLNNKDKMPHIKEFLNDTKKLIKEKRGYLEQFQIDDEEVLRASEKAIKVKVILEELVLNVKSALFDNKLMEFDLNKEKLNENVLGQFHFNRLYSIKTKIITGSDDNTIKIWDLNTGECLQTLLGHQGEVNCLEVVSSDKLVSGSSDKTLKLWDLSTGKCLITFTGHTDWVNCIQKMSSNRIISGSGDQTIKIWNTYTGDCIDTLKGHNGSAMCIQVLSDDKIISGSDDWTIKIWDLASDDCLKTLEGHSDQVWIIKMLSNDKIVSGSADKTIKIWNLESGQCLKTLKSHTGLVYWIDILTSSRIVSCSHDKTIKVWDLNTGNCIRTLRGHTGPIDCIEKISSEKLVSCSVDNSVKIWNVNTGECLSTLWGHTDEVNCVISF